MILLREVKSVVFQEDSFKEEPAPTQNQGRKSIYPDNLRKNPCFI